MKAKISEIFSSIQGEGLYLGKRQVFVRFYGCNMQCSYCDTMSSAYDELSVGDVIDKIASLTLAVTPSLSLRGAKRRGNLIFKSAVSLTGGEPLMHVDYLKLLLKELKALELETYLETNGTLPGALNKVMGMVDIIAMDIKLPSSTKDKQFWDEHEEFLRIARRCDVFIKVVVTGGTKKDEFERAVRIVHNVDLTIPLVIQPVTSCNGVKKISHAKLDNFYNYASSKLKDVRIIPQVHKILRYR